MMATCNCLVRHATTDAERQEAKKALDEARKVGDEPGTMLALAALSPCPNAPTRRAARS